MIVDTLRASLGTELIWLVVVTGFAWIASLVGVVFVVQRRTVQALALVAGPLVGAAAILVLGRIPLVGWPSADPAALRIAAVTFAAVFLVGPLTFGPVAMTCLAGFAFAGARTGPRRWALFAIALAVSLAVGALVVWGGQAAANPLYAWLRAGVYVVTGALVGVAFLSGGPTDQGGPDAGAAAGATWPLIVAAGEASERGVVSLVLILQTTNLTPEKWPIGVEKMLAAVASEWTASQGAVGLSLTFVVLGAIAGLRSPNRLGAVFASAVAAVVALSLLFGSDLGAARFGALAALCVAPVSGG